MSTSTPVNAATIAALNAKVESHRNDIITFMREICAIPSMESQIKDVGERIMAEMR